MRSSSSSSGRSLAPMLSRGAGAFNPRAAPPCPTPQPRRRTPLLPLLALRPTSSAHPNVPLHVPLAAALSTSAPMGRAAAAHNADADEAAGDSALARTPLYQLHLRHGAKMVGFAGYSMPLTYQGVGQVASHKHVRTEAGLFDVGHMVQHIFSGPSATAFLERLTPSSLSELPAHAGTLSVLLSESGGILDDLVVTRLGEPDRYHVVTNAARREEDLRWIRERLDEERADGAGKWADGVTHEVLQGWGLLALQGPKSAEVLSRHTSLELPRLTFGRSAYADVAGVRCHVARGGYTGEDGFEISTPPESSESVAEALLSTPPAQLAGLAARDSLRLEAGMCLYGHDLDETVSPVEAGLSWVVAKARRERGDFLGAERVLRELREGVTRRRVGLGVEGGAPAREGAPVFAEGGEEQIGRVTSGLPSPTLGRAIAMALVREGHHRRGTRLEVEVRGRRRACTVERMPWVETRFWRG